MPITEIVVHSFLNGNIHGSMFLEVVHLYSPYFICIGELNK